MINNYLDFKNVFKFPFIYTPLKNFQRNQICFKQYLYLFGSKLRLSVIKIDNQMKSNLNLLTKNFG